MPPPQRREERSSAQRITAAAEVLFGQVGLKGVSLRQIGVAAGSSNNYAVQYHFGDAEGLVRAILVQRMAQVDRLQQTRLEALDPEIGAHGVRALLDVFLRPLLEIRDEAGEQVYARFIIALLNSPEGPRYFREMFHAAPAAARLQDLLRAAIPDAPTPLLAERLRLAALMVLASAFNQTSAPSDPQIETLLLDDALDVAAAGLTADINPGLLDRMASRHIASAL